MEDPPPLLWRVWKGAGSVQGYHRRGLSNREPGSYVKDFDGFWPEPERLLVPVKEAQRIVMFAFLCSQDQIISSCLICFGFMPVLRDVTANLWFRCSGDAARRAVKSGDGEKRKY